MGGGGVKGRGSGKAEVRKGDDAVTELAECLGRRERCERREGEDGEDELGVPSAFAQIGRAHV